MRVKLVSHVLSDDPEWEIIDKSVPIGTEYEVLGFEHMALINLESGKRRTVQCFLLRGHGSTGYMPTDCFEKV